VNESATEECQRAITEVLRGFDPRDTAVLASRVFTVGDPLTLEQLAVRFSVTRERIRQVEKKCVTKIAARLKRRSARFLTEAAQLLKQRLGAACPADRIFAVVPEAGALTTRAEDPIVHLLILLWIAGPYELFGEWLVREPATRLLRTTQRALDQLTKKGPAPLEATLKRLQDLGIGNEFCLAWLEQVPKFRVVDDALVRWRGSVGDKAETVLALNGSPMSREQILTEIAEDKSVRSLGNALLADKRFRRLGPDLFGLSSWGGTSYSSIQDAIAHEVAGQGGECTIDYLVRVLVPKFGISENSVRSYAQGPRFVRTGGGRIKIRVARDAGQVVDRPRGRSLEFSKRCFRSASAWAYRLQITADTLRGSGTTIPAALAVFVGLHPLGTKRLPSPFGYVSFGWPSLQPTVGSVRDAVMDLEGGIGDYLFIDFAADRILGFRLMTRSRLESAKGLQRALLEMGLEPTGDRERDIADLAASIALPHDLRLDFRAIRRQLRARGEEDLLSLLPENSSSSTDRRALNELLNLATEGL
jgi:hypothetical protein